MKQQGAKLLFTNKPCALFLFGACVINIFPQFYNIMSINTHKFSYSLSLSLSLSLFLFLSLSLSLSNALSLFILSLAFWSLSFCLCLSGFVFLVSVFLSLSLNLYFFVMFLQKSQTLLFNYVKDSDIEDKQDFQVYLLYMRLYPNPNCSVQVKYLIW